MDQQQQSRWRPTGTQILWMGIGGIAFLFVAIVVFGGYYFEWEWTGYPERTPWDWAALLILPVVLAIGGYLFTRFENRRTQQNVEQQRASDRESADQGRQGDNLQAYLDQVGQLLLDKDRPLRQSKEGEEVRTLARARTLTVLRGLDSDRKVTVLQFLYESGLITEEGGGIVSLRGADLSGIVFSGAGLMKAKLSGAVLAGADLSRASLSSADLRGANLRGANLQGANLVGALLSPLDPVPASSYPPVYTPGQAADLSEANLKNSILVGADLTGARLDGADLSGADLIHPRANPPNEQHLPRLVEERGLITSRVVLANLKLETTAQSLKGATMPTGQKYEDWLESSKSSGKAG